VETPAEGFTSVSQGTFHSLTHVMREVGCIHDVLDAAEQFIALFVGLKLITHLIYINHLNKIND